jgi:hypothetical protein
MSVDKIVKLGIKREAGWLYFLRGENLLRTKQRAGIDIEKVRGEIVVRKCVEMDADHYYWLDDDGDIARGTPEDVELLEREDRVKESLEAGRWKPLTSPLSAAPFPLVPAEYRVLSIHGPWAWSIIRAGKDIENRSWSTPYRGTILIHASSHRDGKKALLHRRRLISTCSGLPLDVVPEEFLVSAIIGAVDVEDCVQDSPSPWAHDGAWHWVLRNPRPLEAAVTGVDGKLNLWTWRPNGGAVPASTPEEGTTSRPPTVSGDLPGSLRLEMQWENARAECIVRDDQFIIIEGSTARAKEAASLPDNLRAERKRLRKSGALVSIADSESLLRFSRECAFGSASAAAGVVGANSLNGRVTWKVKGKGISFKEWQERKSQ